MELEPRTSLDKGSAQALIAALRRRLWIERAVFAAVLLGLAGAWLWPSLFPGVWAIYVQGKPLVAMRDRQAVQAVVQQVQQTHAGNPTGSAFAREVRIGRADPARVEITDSRTASEKLDAAWRQHSDQAIVYIDGTAVVSLKSPEEAKTVLERVKAELSAEVGELQAEPEFKEKVEVRVEPTPEDILADADTAVALLKGDDTTEDGVHVVAAGQNGWSIARQHDLTLEELKQRNPDVDLTRLRVGQQLAVSEQAAPLVTVVAEGRKTELEPLSYETELRSTPNMYLGKRLLAQPGKPGLVRVIYRVRCENGEVVERSPIERQVLETPKKKVVVLGVKPRPGR